MYIYDIEVIKNFHSAYFLNVETLEEKYFVIHSSKNQFREYAEFLLDLKDKQVPLIGFNNVSYDGRVIDLIISNLYKFKPIYKSNIGFVLDSIYEYSQFVLNNKIYGKHNIPQIDLYLINHYDNENKRASLKWLEFTMGFQNIEDMPIKHYENIKESQIKDIIAYNRNDVLATYELYKLSINLINLRKELSKKYNIDFINYNNGKIGAELLINFYTQETGIQPYQIKQKIERPTFINLKDVIHHDKIKLKSKILKDVYDYFNNTKVDLYSEKKEVTKVINAYNMEIVYALGGVHGCAKKGIYISDDEWIIIDADVASLYPSIAVILGLYPKHLGPEFFKIYKEKIVDVRLAEKAKPEDERDNNLITAFKESANIPLYVEKIDICYFFYYINVILI